MQNDIRNMVICILDSIPTHQDSPKSIEDISSLITVNNDMSSAQVVLATGIVIEFLEMFGVLTWSDGRCRMLDQIPDYFRRSIMWYLVNNKTILSNWTRKGVGRDISTVNLLDTASYLVKLLEERRLDLSRIDKLDSGYSRFQPVSVLLIKAVDKNISYLLHQWDERAEQFQLIGGRRRNGEAPSDTAKRELQEEISKHDLNFSRGDYDLIPLHEAPIKYFEVSRTYGALTLYEFHLFAVKFNIEVLDLSPVDRWISIEEMKQGVTSNGHRIGNPQLLRHFDSAIEKGIENIPLSVTNKQTPKFIDFIEVKPSISWLGSIDLKALLLYWRRNRRKH